MIPLRPENELVFMAAMLALRRRVAEAEAGDAFARLTVDLELERGQLRERYRVGVVDNLKVSSCNQASPV